MAEGKKKIRRVLKVGRAINSSLSSFVERPVPTDQEVSVFERVVKREVQEQEIDSNLSEIYSDSKGRKVDVSRVEERRRWPFLLRFVIKVIILGLFLIGAYFAYNNWFSSSNDVSGLILTITAPEKVQAGEEISYLIEYRNPTKYPLSHLRLELQYPSGFIFSSSSQEPDSGSYGWDLDDLAPGADAYLTVTGRLIAPPDSVQALFVNLSYIPGSFSSQYRKEASVTSLVNGPGFRADLNYSQTAFIGQENEMTLILSEIGENYLGDFNISFALPAEANAFVSDQALTASSSTTTVRILKSGGASWQVSGLVAGQTRLEIPLIYKINQRSDNPEIKVRLEKKLEDGQSYVFWEKAIRPELVDSDLNLTMLLNDSKNDGAINFGQNLSYSVTYDNRGANTYKDVVIMAVLSGDFLDFNQLSDTNNGQTRAGTIIWTKKEIPALEEIKPGASGEIKFSIGLKSWREGDLDKSLEVLAYSQYGMNNTPAKGEANKSNTVTSRLNSDLELKEQIRYFNDDNLPVGSGPLPPRVGEKTSFKVYWTVTNNLHELSETRAVFSLPSYVNWEGNQATNVGSVYYDETTRQVIWEIGRLPVSVYRVDSEFSISLIPSDTDRNKLLVLSPGSIVSAMDTETKDIISRKSSPRTTKLEDDDIAGLNNSGIIQ